MNFQEFIVLKPFELMRLAWLNAAIVSPWMRVQMCLGNSSTGVTSNRTWENTSGKPKIYLVMLLTRIEERILMKLGGVLEQDPSHRPGY